MKITDLLNKKSIAINPKVNSNGINIVNTKIPIPIII